MNNKTFAIIATVAILAIGGYMAYRYFTSRPLSPTQTTTFRYEGLDVKVTYCRPFKKGRLIFGGSEDALVPNGKYWRLGANEATEISFSQDVNIAGKPLKADTYRMYAVPNESSWQISFNSGLGAWGANEPDYDKDVLKVEVPAEKVSSETEQFTITFASDSTGVNMNIDWDKTHLRVPIARTIAQ